MVFLKIFIYIFIFAISLTLSALDIQFDNIWGNFIQFYPAFIILLFFYSYYTKSRWWLLGFSLLIYGIISFTPIILIFFLLALIIITDNSLSSTFQNITFSYILILTSIFNLYFYIIDKLSPIFNGLFGWENMISYFAVDEIQNIILLTCFTLIIILLNYPLITTLDKRKKLFTVED